MAKHDNEASSSTPQAEPTCKKCRKLIPQGEELCENHKGKRKNMVAAVIMAICTITAVALTAARGLLLQAAKIGIRLAGK